jgi:protein-S-isoprenylcysteine O-methyltransferase Ste14
MAQRLSMLIPVTVLGVIPYGLHAAFDPSRVDLGPLRWLGPPIFLVGLFVSGLSAWLFFTFGQGSPAPWDPPKRFVLMGPYRYVRNPMMLGGCFMILGEAIFLASLLIIGYLAVLMPLAHLYIVLHEEKEMAQRFGHPYLAYKQHVPRWRPKFRWDDHWDQGLDRPARKNPRLP